MPPSLKVSLRTPPTGWPPEMRIVATFCLGFFGVVVVAGVVVDWFEVSFAVVRHSMQMAFRAQMWPKSTILRYPEERQTIAKIATLDTARCWSLELN